MSTPITDGKQLTNLAYHSSVVSGLAIGYAVVGKKNPERGYTKIGFCAV